MKFNCHKNLAAQELKLLKATVETSLSVDYTHKTIRAVHTSPDTVICYYSSDRLCTLIHYFQPAISVKVINTV